MELNVNGELKLSNPDSFTVTNALLNLTINKGGGSQSCLGGTMHIRAEIYVKMWHYKSQPAFSWINQI